MKRSELVEIARDMEIDGLFGMTSTEIIEVIYEVSGQSLSASELGTYAEEMMERLLKLPRSEVVEVGRSVGVEGMFSMRTREIVKEIYHAENLGDVIDEIEKKVEPDRECQHTPTNNEYQWTSNKSSKSALQKKSHMSPQGPHIIAARTNDKLQKLQQWRERYQASEYPSKVAINIAFEALVTEREHTHYENSFGNSAAEDLEEGVEKVRAKEKEIRDKVVTDAKKAYETRSSIGSVQLSGLRSKVDIAASGNNDAVEDLEFNLAYYGGTFELFTGWYAAGLCGLSPKEAMVAITGQSIKRPSDIQAVEGYFSDYASSVLQQIDVYQKLPALW